VSIVTIAEARDHLRIDDTADDAMLQLYLDAVETALAEHLNRALYDSDAGEDTTGLVLTAALRAAILLQVGTLYAHREEVTVVAGTVLRLTEVVARLVDPYRLEMGV
jgi:energy-converting hydrogenase Eha subunit G